MGYVFDQKDIRSELQQKVAAELAEKARKRAEVSDMPDGVDDSAYLRGTKNSSKMLGFWVGIIIVAAIALIVFIIVKAQK